jgi:hypothetical protein
MLINFEVGKLTKLKYMKRKDFLKTLALTAASGSVFLAACGGDPKKPAETKTEPAATPEAAPAPAATADCSDLSGLTEVEVKQRESVQYVAVSTDAEKKCSNCRFFQPGADASSCGGCQLFKGPVAPEGNCKSWFKKEA